MNEVTIVLIKPDAVRRRLVSKILQEFEERTDLSISQIQKIRPTPDVLASIYAEHVNEDYYPRLINMMMAGPSILVVITGEDAVLKCCALKTSIREKYECTNPENLLHTSDSVDSASREMLLLYS